MASKIQIRRGLKQDLPILDNGELGLAQDTQEVFVGGGEANIQLAKQSDLAQSTTQIGTGTNYGEQQNKSESIYTYPNRINFGALNDAPTVANVPYKGIDVIAHWYNDYGLEYTASGANQVNGGYTWYDWKWNHTDAPSKDASYTDYDPSRHPLLGWYKGDDTKVLDWQCYWLASGGVNVVSPFMYKVTGTTDWATPSSKNHWLYQLFNNTKNFKSLKYMPWLLGDFGKTTAELTTANDDVIDNVMAKYKNLHTYQNNGKMYAVAFMWDISGFRFVFDAGGGATNTSVELKRLAAKVKALGYDGLLINARGMDFASANWTASTLTDLENNGVLIYKADYSSRYDTDANYSNSYANYANNAVFPTEKRQVLNVMTSVKTKLPHSSGWNLAGNTPELFRTVLQRAADHISINRMPKMITVYNVSEWAEGGAGLQPNVQDGFGYLDAVKALNSKTSEVIDLEKVKTDSKKLALSNGKDWYVAKVNNKTLNGGANGRLTVVDMGQLPFHDFNDNTDNYVFFTTLTFPASSTEYKVNQYTNVNFGTRRIYVNVYSDYGSDITGVGISVQLRKITI
jgi:hypothetical protein